MTIQEAYNKGLTDAETPIIEALRDLLECKKIKSFPNPELEVLVTALHTQLTWMHDMANSKRSNVGKYAQKAIDESLQLLTKDEEVVS